MPNQLKYLNAINILAMAKIGALQKIYDQFDGDWERAWQSDLSGFLPKERDDDGKLIRADYIKLKKSIDPDREWRRLEAENINISTILDDDYPDQLRHIPDPPFLLYIKGRLAVDRERALGVVGTRAISEYGKHACPHIVEGLARAGMIIVSGLAMGIDTLAHKTALSAGSYTVAVLGCGLDDASLFPAQNISLAREIITKGGAIISEYALGTHGTKFTFPQRNRIISGLTRGTLVIEADDKSGSLITARCALEQDRDVFAVPGSIFAKSSKGTNNVLKAGAKLVTSADDILEEYNITSEQLVLPIDPTTPAEATIIAVLTDGPMTANDIIRSTGLEIATVNSSLIIMELHKRVKNIGGRFTLL